MKILIDIECVDVKYLKYVFNLISCILSYSVYGKISYFFLYVINFIILVLFWVNIINISENKLSKIVYLYVCNIIFYFIFWNMVILFRVCDIYRFLNIWLDYELDIIVFGLSNY